MEIIKSIIASLIVGIIIFFANKIRQYYISSPFLFGKIVTNFIDIMFYSLLTFQFMVYSAILYIAYFANHIKNPVLLIIPTCILIVAFVYGKYVERIWHNLPLKK